VLERGMNNHSGRIGLVVAVLVGVAVAVAHYLRRQVFHYVDLCTVLDQDKTIKEADMEEVRIGSAQGKSSRLGCGEA
jgi:hypothetical protein